MRALKTVIVVEKLELKKMTQDQAEKRQKSNEVGLLDPAGGFGVDYKSNRKIK